MNTHASTKVSVFRMGLLLSLSLLGAACALSPQVVDLHPELETAGVAGAPRTLALEVRDARSDPIIGYRGGVYATATLSAEPDLADQVRTALANVLTTAGWRVVAPDERADTRLSVDVTELKYALHGDRFPRVVETAAAIRASSETGETTRTGEYSDRRTKEVLKPPSEAENEELLNDVLSAALQRLVADKELLSVEP